MKKWIIKGVKKIGYKISNGFSTIKTRIRKTKTKNAFIDQFNEARKQPISKIKSLMLGFTTVLGIFGITMLTSVLPAIAKDLPAGKPTDLCPAPDSAPAPTFHQQVGKTVSSMAGTVCALAANTLPFALGIVCGFIVGRVILHALGK